MSQSRPGKERVLFHIDDEGHERLANTIVTLLVEYAAESVGRIGPKLKKRDDRVELQLGHEGELGQILTADDLENYITAVSALTVGEGRGGVLTMAQILGHTSEAYILMGVKSLLTNHIKDPALLQANLDQVESYAMQNNIDTDIDGVFNFITSQLSLAQDLMIHVCKMLKIDLSVVGEDAPITLDIVAKLLVREAMVGVVSLPIIAKLAQMDERQLYLLEMLHEQKGVEVVNSAAIEKPYVFTGQDFEELSAVLADREKKWGLILSHAGKASRIAFIDALTNIAQGGLGPVGTHLDEENFNSSTAG